MNRVQEVKNKGSEVFKLDQQTFLMHIKQARNGDTASFVELYKLVYQELYHVACLNLRCPQDAADVVSDTVLDAFTGIHNLKDESAFRRWIFQILFAKIKTRQKEYYQKDEADLSELTESFDYVSPELRAALDSLDEKDRLLLTMSVLGGYTSQELASMLGSTASAVRSRLSRMKERLRTELA